MDSANQYTLHLLPEPYLREIRTEPKELDFSSHMLYSLAHREWEMLSDKKYHIIGTFTGKESDIWEEGRDFQFQPSQPKGFVAIPITQPVEETQEDISILLEAFFEHHTPVYKKEAGFIIEELLKHFSITRK